MYSTKSILKKINILKQKKKKIVLCHGVFDLVHYGHLLYFKSAKKFGDYLIVSVTHDKFIKKGPGKPIFNLETRIKYLSSIDVIDMVIPSTQPSSSDVIELVKPNYYVKGPDYRKLKDDKSKKIIQEKKLVEKFGGEIKFTSDLTFSSSSLINSSNLLFNDEQKSFLSKLKLNFGLNQILSEIDKFKEAKVLVLGELIFDNYIFGDIIGKSGKEPHLVFENKYNEYYVGGSGAICRHIQSFVKKVNFLSNFGGEKNLKIYIKNYLTKNIFFKNIKPYKNFSSIIKSRFLDIKSNYKMFGSYSLPKVVESKYSEHFLKIFKKMIRLNDFVIIADYGHGLIPENFFKKIKIKDYFICLNKQINASSVISHNILKYKYSKVLIINETELRYTEKDQKNKIEFVIKKFNKRMLAKVIIVTRGKLGSIYFSKNKFTYCPAFAITPVDKVGAGDAMLSISSLCVFYGVHPSITLLLGSLAASISVQSTGNKNVLRDTELRNMVEYILK